MFEIRKLSNGIKVVFCKLDHIRSLSIGFWIKAGSAYEKNYNNGISHFVEHMLFNGTKQRKQSDIVNDIESLGGEINAFTSKELTCIYTKTLDEHYTKAIDVLSDIYNNSTFNNSGIKKEKKVITQEIKMYIDTPDELIHDFIQETIWKKSDFERSVLGNFDSINKIERDEILQYFNERYTRSRTVISVSGNFDIDLVTEELEKKIKIKNEKEIQECNLLSKYNKAFNFQKKQTEQNHICLSYEGFSYKDMNRYVLNIINSFFGSGMSSRLFQNIREKQGLVYNVYSYLNSNTISGSFIIYAGLDKENTSKFIESVDKEARKIYKNGLSNDELKVSKNRLKSGIIMGLESSFALMSYAGKNLLLNDEIRSFDRIINFIDNITEEQVINVAKKLFDKEQQSIAIIGESY